MHLYVYVYTNMTKATNLVEDIQAQTLKAMADATRMKILLMLEGKGRAVGEIAEFFELSQPTITRHLQTLAQAGLVRRQRAGQHVRYELNPEKLRNICISLASCFPCCCMEVSTTVNIEDKKRTTEKTTGRTSKSVKKERKHP